MADYFFRYKCRQCGIVEKSEMTTNDKVASQALICAVTDTPLPSTYGGMRPSMLSIHVCENGHGVSDLIGYIKRE